MTDTYFPNIADVLKVKSVLQNPKRDIFLPLEIIDLIIDHASYWPHTTAKVQHVTARGGGADSASNIRCLQTLPLGAQEFDPPEPLQETDRDDAKWWQLGFWVNKLGFGPKPVDQGPYKIIWVPPRGIHPCRKIVFELKSHDQGYSSAAAGQGTYEYAYSWFDAGVETVTFSPAAIHTNDPDESDGRVNIIRPSIPWLSVYDPTQPPFKAPEGLETNIRPRLAPGEPLHPFLPPEARVQSNVHASGTLRTHNVTWSYSDCFDAKSGEADAAAAVGRGRGSVDGAFIRSLNAGDCVTLWARARFPGWRNVVEEAVVHIFWAV